LPATSVSAALSQANVEDLRAQLAVDPRNASRLVTDHIRALRHEIDQLAASSLGYTRPSK
jgi:hypothetical protein